MKDRIEKYHKKIEEVKEFVKSDLKELMEKVDLDNPTNDVKILNLENEDDIDKAIYGQGFYIILTDKIFEDNECLFTYKNKTAIYRGHSYFVKRRLLSHLANLKYNNQRKSNETNYKVCLKIESSVNGINIDKKPYKNWEWMVIIIKMSNSSKLMREQAEFAFDELYNKPSKSRE